MTNRTLIKYRIYSILIFIVVFYTQSSLAMDVKDKNEGMVKAAIKYSYNILNAVADNIDRLQGIDLETYVSSSPALVQQSIPSFFPKLPIADVTIAILIMCFRNNEGSKSLWACALTSRYGYELIQSNDFMNAFVDEYISQISEEYIGVLRQGKIDRGAQHRGLFQQQYAYQEDEIKQLYSYLSNWNAILFSEAKSGLINYVIRGVKNLWIKDLNVLKKPSRGVLAFKRYLDRETVLDQLNLRIVRELRTSKSTKKGIVDMQISCSLTRFPNEAVNIVRSNISPDGIKGIKEYALDLSHNQLRWVPAELFSIEQVTHIKLNNNLLCCLPETFLSLENAITHLELGNIEPYCGLFTSRYSRRTTGNTFCKIPDAILKLKKLKHLDMQSVALEEFPIDEVFQFLPELESVNVANNNLSIVPKDDLKNQNDHTISVVNYGNPGSPSIPLWRKMGDYCIDTWIRCNS